jgi:hypothetical protein
VWFLHRHGVSHFLPRFKAALRQQPCIHAPVAARQP